MTQTASNTLTPPAPQDGELASATINKYVTFALGDEVYAITAASVNEVLRYTEITPVPGARPSILGIINLRGNVVTVLDARILFGLPRVPVSSQSRIVIVDLEDYAIGVLVDSVSEVADLNSLSIESSPNTGNETAARFIQGVYNRDEALIILVDFGILESAH
jgi:purine-binding chemotaxis protein CheW